MKTSLLILMFALSAHAATYFVDVTNGLDSNNGTGGPPTGNVYFKYRLR